jgi:sec-independent protein translocase protein TatB
VLGINAPEFLVIALIALLVIGPERLPHYAAQLGRLAREARRMASGAKQQVREELGPDFDDIDWQKLDPRQYDPRRIVREALTDAWEDDEEPTPRRRGGSTGATAAAAVGAAGMAAAAGKPASRPGRRPGGHASRPGDATGPAPFDTEAT